jgi:hypothetical protein
MPRQAIPKLQTENPDLNRVQDAILPALNGLLRGALADLVRSGRGSPEGVVPAPVGTLYLRTDGGAGTTLYAKESGGSGASGWAAK